jgi:hypothetical protein
MHKFKAKSFSFIEKRYGFIFVISFLHCDRSKEQMEHYQYDKKLNRWRERAYRASDQLTGMYLYVEVFCAQLSTMRSPKSK